MCFLIGFHRATGLNQEILKENLENHMKMLTQNSQRVQKYFSHKEIQYAA